MIGRTNTGGGGGTGGGVLAITHGTTLPTRAAQNTIFIYTDKEIPSYALSATRPESPVEYMAHVMIAESGNVVVDSVDGGNWIKIYPQFVSLYVDGAWKNVNALIYQNGIWTQFSYTFMATINITYPAGSVCSCSDGVTTLTAPDTSGSWGCIVPNTGTWTVSCTDGDNTSSTDVIITADGQSENVGVSYLEYVFQNGTFTNGSWGKYTTTASSYSGAVTLEGQELHMKATAQTKAIFFTTEKFNTRGKKEIVFTVTKITNTNTSVIGKIHFGIAATQNDDSFVTEIFVDAVASNNSQEFVVPIKSEHYGDYYIKSGLIRDVMYEDNVWISEIKMQ